MSHPQKSSEVLSLLPDTSRTILVVGDVSDSEAVHTHLLRAHGEIRETIARIDIRCAPDEIILQVPNNTDPERVEAQDLLQLKEGLVEQVTDRTVTKSSPTHSEGPLPSYHVFVSNIDSLLDQYEASSLVTFLLDVDYELAGIRGFLFFNLPLESDHGIVRSVYREGVNNVVEFRDQAGTLQYRWFSKSLDDSTEWQSLESVP